LNDAVRRAFEDDRRVENCFALLLCPLVLVVSLLKGLDGISYWGATQALVDYRFGLVKRGLLGAWLARPLHFEHIAHFYLFSLLVLAALLVLLIAFGLYGGLRERFATHTLLPLYFSSYAITFFAYCLGYNDLLLFCLTIPLLFLRSATARLIAAVPITVVCVLLHEIFLFLVLPLLLLSFLLETTLTEDRSARRALFLKAGILLILSLGVTFRVALRPSLTSAQIAQLRADFAHRADFPLNPEVTELMGRSTADNMHLLWLNAHTGAYWKRQAGTLITMFPNTLVLCICIALALRSTERPVPRWLRYACFAAALSPLGLHLLAWDADRWNAETITTSLLVLILICRFTRGSFVVFSPRLRYAILLLIIFNISIRAVVLEGHELAGSKPWQLLKSHF
jgi:hypothetical protein